jgi:hypothetical protein
LEDNGVKKRGKVADMLLLLGMALNQIRGLLLERGIILRQGRCHVDTALHRDPYAAPEAGQRAFPPSSVPVW